MPIYNHEGIIGDVLMFKNIKEAKNYLNSNELILKGMLKRRHLAISAIAHICDTKYKIRVIK